MNYDAMKRTALSIPCELRALPQWVCWQYKHISHAETVVKVPINPVTGKLASVNLPNTWGTFEAAISACSQFNCDGIGFVLTADDGFCVIELESCRGVASGQLIEWGAEFVGMMASYTEVSPCESAVTIIVRGTLQRRGRTIKWLPSVFIGPKFPEIGVYDRARFFCLTGQRLPDAPQTCEQRQAELVELIAKIEKLTGKRFA